MRRHLQINLHRAPSPLSGFLEEPEKPARRDPNHCLIVVSSDCPSSVIRVFPGSSRQALLDAIQTIPRPEKTWCNGPKVWHVARPHLNLIFAAARKAFEKVELQNQGTVRKFGF